MSLEAEPDAKVLLIVNKSGFFDVLATTKAANERGTTHSLKMEQDHPKVHVRDDGGKTTKTLVVKKGGATLRIRIDSEDPQEVYYPLGIAFVRRDNDSGEDPGEDLLGRENFKFSNMHLFGRSLYITDSFNDVGVGDKYKFSVIIQREKDGAIGIIDPPIEHEN